MNGHEAAAWQIHQFLSHLQIPYTIIGGMAVGHWGDPRFTRDVDLTIVLPLEDPQPLIQKIIAQFPPRINDALTFALQNRVILLQVGNSPVDVTLALPGFEEEVMSRAKLVEIESGKRVFICSAEDLIVYKAFAGRP